MFKCKRSLPHPKDGPWAWLVLLAATLSSAVFMGFCMSFGILLPTLMVHFRSSKQSAAWVASLALSMTTLLSPVTAALVNRFGCRLVAMFGAVLCSIAMIATSFAESIEFMFFSYGFLFGCGSSFINLSGILIIPEYFVKWRSLAVGIATGGQTAGTIVYGPCLEMLLSAVGWRWTFRVVAAIIFVVVFIVCVYDPNEVREESARKGKLFDCSVWRSPRFVLITLVICVGMFARYIPIVHLGQYAKELGISYEGAGKLYLFLGLTATLSRPASGLLCQVKGVKPWFVLEVSVILTAITFLITPYLTSYQLMVVFAVLHGLVDGLFMAGANILALNCFENFEKRASGFGIMFLCASLFLGCAPPLAGVLADTYKSYNPAFYMSAGCCVLASVIGVFIPCTKKDKSLKKDNNVETTDQLLVPTYGYEFETSV